MAVSPYVPRVKWLQELVEKEGGCGVIIQSPSNVLYFTGYGGAGVLIATRDWSGLLVPPLEYLRALQALEETGAGVEVVVYQPYQLPGGLELGGKPRVIEKPLADAVASLIGRDCKVLHDGIGLGLYEKLSKTYTSLVDVSQRVAARRSIKEWWELERITMAARIAEEALSVGLDHIEDNVSEAEIAAAIEYTMRRLGSIQPAFPTIVAFGLNTVYPHAEASTERRLRPGMPVLIDLGAVYKGYRSDMTRTIAFGEVEGFREVAETVAEAVDEAIDAIEPGVECREVDAIARRVLAKKGLDKYFIHSLGHGVGIDVHEEPRLSPDCKIKMREGMVVTIEPGVYIPGKLGVRIEELVVVTSRGARRITSFPVELWS